MYIGIETDVLYFNHLYILQQYSATITPSLKSIHVSIRIVFMLSNSRCSDVIGFACTDGGMCASFILFSKAASNMRHKS